MTEPRYQVWFIVRSMTGDGRPQVFRNAPAPDSVMDPSKMPYPMPESIPPPLDRPILRDPLITGTIVMMYVLTLLTVVGSFDVAANPGQTEGYKVVLVSLSGAALALLVLGTGSLLADRPNWEAMASPIVLLATYVLAALIQGSWLYMWAGAIMVMTAIVIIGHARMTMPLEDK